MTKTPHQSTFYPRSKRPSRRNLLYAITQRLKLKYAENPKVPSSEIGAPGVNGVSALHNSSTDD